MRPWLSPAGRDEIVARERVHTPSGDYPGILRAITSLVQRIEARIGARAAVGIGIPGAISPWSRRVKNSNSQCLNGQYLDADLSALLQRPLRFSNDANCFALSEAVDGAARDADVVFGAILGTGVGGGLVINGRTIAGANAIGGEWGHNPLPWPRDNERPGPLCYCGKQGCIESFLSGPALAAAYRSATGKSADPATIVDAAAAGEEAAEMIMQNYEERLARALASVINMVDPHVIILGGGLSKVDRLYAGVQDRLPEYVFSDHLATRLLPPEHGDASGVRGAAWLWPESADRQ